jgi:hypothetical protein
MKEEEGARPLHKKNQAKESSKNIFFLTFNLWDFKKRTFE